MRKIRIPDKTKEILRLIRRHEPATTKDFRSLGMSIRKIGKGLFRTSYRITDTSLIVKIPNNLSGIVHTRYEVSRINSLKKHRLMQPHLPTIYWWGKETGVLVMMYYPKFDSHEDQVDSLGMFISKLIFAAIRVDVSDLHSENIHKGPRRTSVIIDLGF